LTPANRSSIPTRRSSDLGQIVGQYSHGSHDHGYLKDGSSFTSINIPGATDTRCVAINRSGMIVGEYDHAGAVDRDAARIGRTRRSEEHTSELQSPYDLVC